MLYRRNPPKLDSRALWDAVTRTAPAHLQAYIDANLATLYATLKVELLRAAVLQAEAALAAGDTERAAGWRKAVSDLMLTDWRTGARPPEVSALAQRAVDVGMALQAGVTQPEPEPARPFGVGEMLDLTAPDGLSVDRVMYRGKIGEQATVMLNGYQMTVPVSRLSRPAPEPEADQVTALVAEFEELAGDTSFAIQALRHGDRVEINIPEALDRLAAIAQNDDVVGEYGGKLWGRYADLQKEYEQTVGRAAAASAADAEIREKLRQYVSDAEKMLQEHWPDYDDAGLADEVRRTTSILDGIPKLLMQTSDPEAQRLGELADRLNLRLRRVVNDEIARRGPSKADQVTALFAPALEAAERATALAEAGDTGPAYSEAINDAQLARHAAGDVPVGHALAGAWHSANNAVGAAIAKAAQVAELTRALEAIDAGNPAGVNRIVLRQLMLGDVALLEIVKPASGRERSPRVLHIAFTDLDTMRRTTRGLATKLNREGMGAFFKAVRELTDREFVPESQGRKSRQAVTAEHRRPKAETWESKAAKIADYDAFAAMYRQAFAEANRYGEGQVGAQVWIDRMAQLADMYPQWESRVFGEGVKPKPAPKPAPAPKKKRKKRTFTADVGETVIFTDAVGETSPVQYRGAMGDKAVVIAANGYQMEVPLSMLRHMTEKEKAGPPELKPIKPKKPTASDDAPVELVFPAPDDLGYRVTVPRSAVRALAQAMEKPGGSRYGLAQLAWLPEWTPPGLASMGGGVLVTTDGHMAAFATVGPTSGGSVRTGTAESFLAGKPTAAKGSPSIFLEAGDPGAFPQVDAVYPTSRPQARLFFTPQAAQALAGYVRDKAKVPSTWSHIGGTAVLDLAAGVVRYMHGGDKDTMEHYGTHPARILQDGHGFTVPFSTSDELPDWKRTGFNLALLSIAARPFVDHGFILEAHGQLNPFLLRAAGGDETIGMLVMPMRLD